MQGGSAQSFALPPTLRGTIFRHHVEIPCRAVVSTQGPVSRSNSRRFSPKTDAQQYIQARHEFSS
jgi:hypothetical protein